MRKITTEASKAFYYGEEYRKDNTIVTTHCVNTEMALHGNTIANVNQRGGALTISDAGWRTNTTKERLNGILNTYNLGGLKQQKGVWWLIPTQGSAIEWKGEHTFNINN